MNYFFTALTVLTVFPLKRRASASDIDLARSIIFFPLVGFIIGFLLMAMAWWLSPILSPGPLAAVVLVLSVLITGGLHLDGLADLCDGLAAGGDRERILSVMKDSRVGAFGVIGLVIVLLFKYSFFEEIIHRGWFHSFLIMGLLSRWSMVLASYLGQYARKEGTARPFIGQIGLMWFTGSTGMAMILSWMFLKEPGLLVFLSVALFVFLFLHYLKLKLGGLTGDTLGALNEMSEVLVLFFILIAGHFIKIQ